MLPDRTSSTGPLPDPQPDPRERWLPQRAFSPPHNTGAAASRPFLVPSPHAASPRRTPLQLWHLLSLDAPTVAAVWTVFLAWSAGVHLALWDPAAMFLAVWMLYAGDRLLDAKPLFTDPLLPELRSRHRFHHRHRTAFLRGIALASLPLTFLLHRTQPAVLHLYILLASLLVVWLLLVHARPTPSATAHRLPKELAVGLFFPAAVFIPTVARAPSLRPALLPGALLFAVLCSLNCLFLYAWEHPASTRHAHPSTRWAVGHLQPRALTCTFLSAVLALLAVALPRTWPATLPHPAAVFLACGLSSALLLLLHARRRRISPLTRRALADFVLLTPIAIALTIVLLRHVA